MAGDYEKAITIQKAMRNIIERRYLLPAIQRKFEWDNGRYMPSDCTNTQEPGANGFPFAAEEKMRLIVAIGRTDLRRQAW